MYTHARARDCKICKQFVSHKISYGQQAVSSAVLQEEHRIHTCIEMEYITISWSTTEPLLQIMKIFPEQVHINASE